MRTCFVLILLVVATASVNAQTAEANSRSASAKSNSRHSEKVADELRNIREMLVQQEKQIAAQAEEIQQLRQGIADRNKQVADALVTSEISQSELRSALALQRSESSRADEQRLAAHEQDIAKLQTELKATSSVASESSKKSASSMQVGFGSVRFNGLLQVWGVAGTGGFHDTFRVRRAEMKFTGDISHHVHWTLMIDPSKVLSVNYVGSVGTLNQASRILQDAFITIEKHPYLHIDAGQLKIPLSLEGAESSAALATTERALFMSDRLRGGAYGDIRDVGILLTSKFGKRVTVYLGEYNSVGDRQNDVAVNDQKATVGRVTVKPVSWLHLGTSGAYSNGGAHADRPRRDRIGAELMVLHRGFKFQSEWMQGREGDVLRQGYYAFTTYRLRGKAASLEPVLRFDTFDPDVSHTLMNASTAPERDYIAGVNWYVLDTHFKMQANYTRKTFQRELSPTRDMLFVNLQTSW